MYLVVVRIKIISIYIVSKRVVVKLTYRAYSFIFRVVIIATNLLLVLSLVISVVKKYN